MKAMIMAAGAGTRLMPLTGDRPKPMVPMANRPLMEHTLQHLRRHGAHRLIANLHYYGAAIRDYFGDGAAYGVELQYSEEEQLWGTAGGVRRCAWFLDDTFLVVSGDGLTDIDLTGLVRAHRRQGALATIALKEVVEVEQYGVVITDEDGRIRAFQEKPRRQEALSSVVNTGIYVFEPEIFDYIPRGEFYDFGSQVFPHLVRDGAPFYGHVVEGYWCDVGTIDVYRQAHCDVLHGCLDYAPVGHLLRGELGARVLLGEGVELGRGVTFKGYVSLGPDCRLDDGVLVEDSVIWAGSLLERGCQVRAAVIGEGCVIGAEAVIRPGAVVGSACAVRAGTHLPPNTRIFRQPHP
ncbi:MAG: NDP-sugar synthase [Syntrophomonadaceae bacterium]|nr:NDP-sugar synthase [Syntrophomonadaceae bacterium]